MERSRWNGKAEEGGVSRGRPSLGGRAWPRTLVPCEQQPPAAPCPQPGLPPCYRPAATTAAATAPSPLLGRRLPARAGSWSAGGGGGGGGGGERWREGGREEGGLEEGREVGREQGGRGVGEGEIVLVGAGGPCEENADEKSKLHWTKGPPPGPPLPTTPCHRPAQAVLGTGAHEDERHWWEELSEGPRGGERGLQMEKNAEKQRGGSRPTNSQGQGQGKSPGIKKQAT